MMGQEGESLKDDLDSTLDSVYQDTFAQSCGRTFTALGSLFRHKEFSLPIAFFFINGIFVPNFDDLHQIFLTQVIGMPSYVYEFLNILNYIGILFFTMLINQCFPNTQTWILVIVSIVLFILQDALMLMNATRKNIEYGISDEVINGFIFFLGTQSVSTIAHLPV